MSDNKHHVKFSFWGFRLTFSVEDDVRRALRAACPPSVSDEAIGVIIAGMCALLDGRG